MKIGRSQRNNSPKIVTDLGMIIKVEPEQLRQFRAARKKPLRSAMTATALSDNAFKNVLKAVLRN